MHWSEIQPDSPTLRGKPISRGMAAEDFYSEMDRVLREARGTRSAPEAAPPEH